MERRAAAVRPGSLPACCTIRGAPSTDRERQHERTREEGYRISTVRDRTLSWQPPLWTVIHFSIRESHVSSMAVKCRCPLRHMQKLKLIRHKSCHGADTHGCLCADVFLQLSVEQGF